jgi:hypothetical protein
MVNECRGGAKDARVWLMILAEEEDGSTSSLITGLGAAALIGAAMMRLNLMVRMVGDGFGFEFVSCCL